MAIIKSDNETDLRISKIAEQLGIEIDEVIGTCLGIAEWHINLHDRQEALLVVLPDGSVQIPKLSTVRIDDDGVSQPVELFPVESDNDE